MNKPVKYILLFIGFIFLMGYLLPDNIVIPVKNGQPDDWNHNTFWYEPWGKSGVHKGIDIFADHGTELISATYGLVIYKASLNLGGNVLIVLGPKWRLHYYAHLASTTATIGDYVKPAELIGYVGNTGNAKNKPAHVHYSIVSIFPYFWRWDHSTQGWKKMFYLNPGELLLKNNNG